MAVGGTWHQDCKCEAGMIDSSECLRCHDGVDSTLHRTWLCNCNGGGTRSPTSFLVPRAIAEQHMFPRAWMQGIIPAAWTAVSAPAKNPAWSFGN
eukprot:552219-Pyramimonas_sp.AAC.1